MRKSILVTGAGGYIGRHVVKCLLDFGVEVCAIDINTKMIDPRANIIQYNIFESDENVYEELGRPDICLHLAWVDGFSHNKKSHIEYLPKHYNFACNLIKGGLKQFAALGSMHEIGYYVGSIDENTPSNPMSLYGVSKNSLRQSLMVLRNQKEFVFQWLRAFYIYGDDSNNNSIFTKILEASERGQTKFPFTLGENEYDFIHIDDLALEIAMSILQEKVTGTINCCLGRPVRLKDKVEEFIIQNKLDISLSYGAYPERIYDSKQIYGDNKKILKILKDACNSEISDLRISQLIKKMEAK